MMSINQSDTTGRCRMKFVFAQESSINDVIIPSSDDDVNSLAGLPSVLVPYDSESLFYQYFSRCPVTLQLTNINIKSLSDAADHSIDHSFDNNDDLRQWLTQHAEQRPAIKFHVIGNICGKLCDIMNRTRMTDSSISFECSLSTHQMLIHVDDSTISMRALLKLTNSAMGIPMVASIASEVAVFTMDNSLSESEIKELDDQTVDVKEFAKYHKVSLSHSTIIPPCTVGWYGNVTVNSFYPHPCFIDRRLVVTTVTENVYEMRFDESHILTELDVMMFTPDEVRLSSSMVLGKWMIM